MIPDSEPFLAATEAYIRRVATPEQVAMLKRDSESVERWLAALKRLESDAKTQMAEQIAIEQTRASQPFSLSNAAESAAHNQWLRKVRRWLASVQLCREEADALYRKHSGITQLSRELLDLAAVLVSPTTSSQGAEWHKKYRHYQLLLLSYEGPPPETPVPTE